MLELSTEFGHSQENQQRNIEHFQRLKASGLIWSIAVVSSQQASLPKMSLVAMSGLEARSKHQPRM
eukprot:4425431-Amphidinium_carterae.2